MWTHKAYMMGFLALVIDAQTRVRGRETVYETVVGCDLSSNWAGFLEHDTARRRIVQVWRN